MLLLQVTDHLANSLKLKSTYLRRIFVNDRNRKPRIETIEISDDAKFGKFVVEPLERGYGTTLGNSLRRILLSSLPGAAVKYIEIEGVLHEFSAIDNVVEDVSTIIMNIKN